MHSSWVLALLCVGFVCGVALALMVRIEWWVGLGAAIPVVVSVYVCRVYVMPIVITGAMCIGLGYGSAHLSNPYALSDVLWSPGGDRQISRLSRRSPSSL